MAFTADCKNAAATSTRDVIRSETGVWSMKDISPARGTNADNVLQNNQIADVDIVPPPTPFRLLITPSETETSLSTDSSSKRISNDLKKEIELSLLHWPNGSDNVERERSYMSLQRPSRSSKTLPMPGGRSSSNTLPAG